MMRVLTHAFSHSGEVFAILISMVIQMAMKARTEAISRVRLLGSNTAASMLRE